jgi:GntR family transcriptional regulator/MocR family aminotransferase
MLDDRGSAVPLYKQVYDSIRRSILEGEVEPGTRLPATRALAIQLSVSRLTVVNAYDQLLAEGYIEGRAGSGTYVASELPDELLAVSSAKRSVRSGAEPRVQLSRFGEHLAAIGTDTLRARTISAIRPFQHGLPALDKFPFDIWAKIALQVHRDPPRSVLAYGDPQGYEPLRKAIASHLRSSRGVVCDQEQVIVTSGAQQALDLCVRIFLAEGDTAVMEDPCYLEARNSFAAAGANVVGVAVDSEGIDIDRAPERAKKAKLIYVTPSHQYPLGVTMSLSRRLELIEWAKQQNALILEDDYDSEFRYSGRPLASLQGLDPEGRVLYIGTFSKTVFPSIRIGCLVVPRKYVPVFTAARAVIDVHSSLIDQVILSRFIADGHYQRHIRRMRKLYDERQSFLVSECRKHLGGLIDVTELSAGMQIVGWLPKGVDDVETAARAAEHGVKTAAVSTYSSLGLERGGLILGHSGFDQREARAGVKKLKAALEAAL